MELLANFWCRLISCRFCVLQLGSFTDCPAVIVEQVPHSHLFSYTGLACEQSQDHQQLVKGQHTHTNTYALTSAFLYLSGSHFMIEVPLSSATRCNSFFFLYKKKTKVSIQILFKKIKVIRGFEKKKNSLALHMRIAPRAHGPPSAEIQEVKKENISGLFLGGKTTVKWIILGCRRGQSELQHTCYSFFLTRTFEK